MDESGVCGSAIANFGGSGSFLEHEQRLCLPSRRHPLPGYREKSQIISAAFEVSILVLSLLHCLGNFSLF